MTSGSEILVLPRSSAPRDRARVVGCDIDRLDMEQTVQRCAEIIDSGGPVQHVAVNVAKVVAMRDNDRLREIVERCELVSVDGQPLVWASRLLGDPLPERVAGIDLMFRLLELAQERGYRVFILGAKDDVLATAVERLGERYPGLVVAGSHHGWFADEDSMEICSLVREAEPHILLVAMTSPRKEYWLAEHAADLGVPFSMGVGGSIDIVAGVTKRAPRWMQRMGLEWFYRFAQEPLRLGPRYLRTNLRFVGLLARELLPGRRRPR
jgi:N-acetylglucosaminyldiphosphoundecaprenol N-acetyl-beta-D-mannosaminyltransferase